MKKTISLFMILTMVLGIFTLVPFNASAAEAEADQNAGASGGTTGGCTWALDDDGVLTISGNGAMDDYYFNAPWENQIKSVIIENGVTGIGKLAFANCPELRTVTIPRSVTEIGSGAFEYPVIYCYEGSYAYQYASDNGIPCVLFSDIENFKDKNVIYIDTSAISDKVMYESFLICSATDGYSEKGYYAYRLNANIWAVDMDNATSETDNVNSYVINPELMTFSIYSQQYYDEEWRS